MTSEGRESGWGARVVVVLLSLGLLLTVPQWVLTHPIREERDDMRKALEQIQAEVSSMERENQRLREELDLLSRDPRMQDIRIRDELQLIRPDELLLLFGDDPDPTAFGLVPDDEEVDGTPTPDEPADPEADAAEVAPPEQASDAEE